MIVSFAEQDVSITAATATEELSPGFSLSAAEERAFRLIGGWLDESARRSLAGESVSAELTAHFRAWLDDPRDRQAKARALDLIMDMCCDKPRDPGDPITIPPNDNFYTIFNIH